jgi:hypothetical protein
LFGEEVKRRAKDIFRGMHKVNTLIVERHESSVYFMEKTDVS